MRAKGLTRHNTKLLCEQQASNKLLLSALRPDSRGSIEREREREREKGREREREEAKLQREQVLLCVSSPDSA